MGNHSLHEIGTNPPSRFSLSLSLGPWLMPVLSVVLDIGLSPSLHSPISCSPNPCPYSFPPHNYMTG